MNADLKAKAIEEFRIYWICAAYLCVALGAFMWYRRLILAEEGVAYLNYGIAAIEAMIIAKVILIGKALNVGTRYEHKPLVLSVAYKSIMFGGVVFVFGVIEHVVTGLIARDTFAEIVQKLTSIGLYELLARMLMMTIAFIPMFAFWELGRVIGSDELRAIFLEGRAGEWPGQERAG